MNAKLFISRDIPAALMHINIQTLKCDRDPVVARQLSSAFGYSRWEKLCSEVSFYLFQRSAQPPLVGLVGHSCALVNTVSNNVSQGSEPSL